MRVRNKLFGGLIFGAMIGLTSCNRMATPPAEQLLKDADARAANGDFLLAIDLYERALDGSIRSADIHYRIALLYDDKMHDPLNAIHHFKRYLTLVPSGGRTEEVKTFLKRDEVNLATELSGDSIVSRGEAARLKKENLDLRKALDESRAQSRASVASEKKPARASRVKASPRPKQTKHKR